MAHKPHSKRWFERVREELLKNGKVEERPLVHYKDRENVFGYQQGDRVFINPVGLTVETLIHELLHRRYPKWGEAYVKARTSEIMRSTSSEEQQQLFDSYQDLVKRVKKPKIVK